MMMPLTRPMTVVLRVDRHATLAIGSVIESLGYQPDSAQHHEVQLPTANVWRIWRIYPRSGVVDQVPPLTPQELAALETQPGILGVWAAR